MSTARFKFYGDLVPLLPHPDQEDILEATFNPGQSAKHLIESWGVPHTEIQAVHANGQPASLDYLVQDADWIEVFPFQPAGSPAADPRFILDNHLGRLAADLRMLGFDCLYRNDYQDDELAETAGATDRILLTRDRQLLMRKTVLRGRLLRSLLPDEQLTEILQRYNLYSLIHPFLRCIRCNGLLQPVEKEAVLDRLEPLTRRYFNEFRICPDCQQVY